MTTIRTTCSDCGEIKLTVADVGLELAPGADGGDYRFDCPICGTTQRRPATPRVVSILLATGVEYTVVAAPIGEAEIAAFSAALAGPGWFRELASTDS